MAAGGGVKIWVVRVFIAAAASATLMICEKDVSPSVVLKNLSVSFTTSLLPVCAILSMSGLYAADSLKSLAIFSVVSASLSEHDLAISKIRSIKMLSNCSKMCDLLRPRRLAVSRGLTSCKPANGASFAIFSTMAGRISHHFRIFSAFSSACFACSQVPFVATHDKRCSIHVLFKSCWGMFCSVSGLSMLVIIAIAVETSSEAATISVIAELALPFTDRRVVRTKAIACVNSG